MPRGGDGEAIEGESARGVSSPAGGGRGGLPLEIFKKKNDAIWCILGPTLRLF